MFLQLRVYQLDRTVDRLYVYKMAALCRNAPLDAKGSTCVVQGGTGRSTLDLLQFVSFLMPRYEESRWPAPYMFVFP
jgi:hypothetical protein